MPILLWGEIGPLFRAAIAVRAEAAALETVTPPNTWQQMPEQTSRFGLRLDNPTHVHALGVGYVYCVQLMSYAEDLLAKAVQASRPQTLAQATSAKPGLIFEFLAMMDMADLGMYVPPEAIRVDMWEQEVENPPGLDEYVWEELARLAVMRERLSPVFATAEEQILERVNEEGQRLATFFPFDDIEPDQMALQALCMMAAADLLWDQIDSSVHDVNVCLVITGLVSVVVGMNLPFLPEEVLELVENAKINL